MTSERSKTERKASPARTARAFGRAIMERRRALGLTQVAVAKQVGCRPNYIGYLEAGVRHPSDDLVLRLAQALHLDPHELFLLANPAVRDMTGAAASPGSAVWEEFRSNKSLHARHRITDRELDAIGRIAQMGGVRSEHDILFLLDSIRHARG